MHLKEDIANAHDFCCCRWCFSFFHISKLYILRSFRFTTKAESAKISISPHMHVIEILHQSGTCVMNLHSRIITTQSLEFTLGLTPGVVHGFGQMCNDMHYTL